MASDWLAALDTANRDPALMKILAINMEFNIRYSSIKIQASCLTTLRKLRCLHSLYLIWFIQAM